jgi:hypothetical protein
LDLPRRHILFAATVIVFALQSFEIVTMSFLGADAFLAARGEDIGKHSTADPDVLLAEC